MFPQGGPGVGLLLLRIAIAAIFALNVTHRFNFSSNALYWLVVSLIVLICLALVVGFLTTIFSIVACVAAVANLFLGDQINPIYILRIFRRPRSSFLVLAHI